jgi:tRNA A-37 threonylcarbamoyl transferase component Bud32
MKIEVLERLESKRNQVYKVRLNEGLNKRLGILKKYRSDNRKLLNSEYQNIKRLSELGILVPKVIYKGSDYLVMEYIQGELVADMVEKLDTGGWIEEFSRWMAKLHSFSKYNGRFLKMDVNLRNFIYSKGKIYGIDFEQMGYGDIRIDLGNICFFILTNEPPFEKEKHIITRRFLKGYEYFSKIKLKEMGKFLLQARAEAKKRRCISRC